MDCGLFVDKQSILNGLIWVQIFFLFETTTIFKKTLSIRLSVYMVYAVLRVVCKIYTFRSIILREVCSIDLQHCIHRRYGINIIIDVRRAVSLTNIISFDPSNSPFKNCLA